MDEIQKQPELKPCPFCGSKAKYELSDFGSTMVYCSAEDEGIDCAVNPKTGCYDSHESGAAAWNTRSGDILAALQRDNATVTAAFAQQSQQWDVEAKELRDKCEALKRQVARLIVPVSDLEYRNLHIGWKSIREAFLTIIAARAAEQENGNG